MRMGSVISIPNFRHDIGEAADIIEEISRVHGFEHISRNKPGRGLKPQKLSIKGTFSEQ